MKWTEIPAGRLHAAEQRLRVAFGNNADVVVNRINTDKKFVLQLAEHMIMSAIQLPENPQWIRAREIMGKNFFGVEEAVRHFGVSLTDQQLTDLSEILFPEEVLKELKDTHILVAVLPLSILEIRNKMDRGLFCNEENVWHDHEPFIKERGEASWQLIRTTPVDNSTSKYWDGQQALIGECDEVPTCRVMVYTIIGHYLVTGEHLFKGVHVRTSSVDSRGDCAGVGRFSFGSKGLGIHHCFHNARSVGLGVSSARKPSMTCGEGLAKIFQ